MRILPITAGKDFGTIKVNVPEPKAIDLSPLEAQIKTLSNDFAVLQRHAEVNRKGIRLLLALHSRNWNLFNSAGITSIGSLAQLDAPTRRSAFARLKKSKVWTDETKQQLTKKEFDEICSAAKVVMEE